MRFLNAAYFEISPPKSTSLTFSSSFDNSNSLTWDSAFNFKIAMRRSRSECPCVLWLASNFAPKLAKYFEVRDCIKLWYKQRSSSPFGSASMSWTNDGKERAKMRGSKMSLPPIRRRVGSKAVMVR